MKDRRLKVFILKNYKKGVTENKPSPLKFCYAVNKEKEILKIIDKALLIFARFLRWRRCQAHNILRDFYGQFLARQGGMSLMSGKIVIASPPLCTPSKL